MHSRVALRHCGPVQPLHATKGISADDHRRRSGTGSVRAGRPACRCGARGRSFPAGRSPGWPGPATTASGPRATALALSGPAPLADGPADVVFVAEEPGVGLGRGSPACRCRTPARVYRTWWSVAPPRRRCGRTGTRLHCGQSRPGGPQRVRRGGARACGSTWSPGRRRPATCWPRRFAARPGRVVPTELVFGAPSGDFVRAHGRGSLTGPASPG